METTKCAMLRDGLRQLGSNYDNLMATLGEGLKELGLGTTVADELLCYLLVQRDLYIQAEEAPGAPRYPTASDLSPSESMDKLLHWVLLNTDIREQVEAALDTRIIHSTRTAGLPDEAKVARQLATMNLMEWMGFMPQLSVWREAGSLMEATCRLHILSRERQVLGTVWVNQHVIPAWMFQMEAMLRGLLCVNIEWEAAARRRQASCGNPVSSHAGEHTRSADNTSGRQQRQRPPHSSTDATITVFVQVQASGRHITVECYPDETVEDLKDRIHDKEGISADQQRLICKGKQLQDESQLSSCGLSNGCTVHLVLRLRGC